jgi:signal transduction histidine kinase
LFIERISRFAKNYEHSKYQLARMQRDLERLLQQHEQELIRAIESERSSLRREIHDKLMQELSAVLLQTSVMLMRNAVDGNVQLSATEAAKMETSLRRVAIEARNVMQALKPTQSPSIETKGE